MASTYLTRSVTTTQADSARYKFTVSVWVKTSLPVSSSTIWQDYYSDAYRTFLRFDTGIIAFKNMNNSSASAQLVTNQVFRDINGWYHIVVVGDTTQTTASDRLKMYVNGQQVTSFSSSTYPNQNTGFELANNNWTQYIGARNSGGTIGTHFDGSMSHFHYTESYAYAPTDFGSTDATTGEWKINTNPSVTYGTNGFFILKDGNSVTDASTNSNNFTVAAGTLTKTEDNPSNVFATMNALSAGSDMAFTFGNTGIRNDVNTWNSGLSTIAPATGKYYWEVYVHGGGDNNTGVSLSSAYGGNHSQVDAGRVVYSRNGYIYREGLSGQNNYATGVTYGDGDYIGVAFDTENGVLTFYKNGTAVTNGATTDTSFLRSNNEYLVQCGLYNGGEFRFNFGNGAFGSTQLTGTTYTGAGSNGIFKYTVPTGFTALSTKGLNL